MNYLVTGACGFIASRIAEFLLAENHSVVGIDNMNDAYEVRLKKWRLERLLPKSGFTFHKADICDFNALEVIFEKSPPFDAVINLAARAGVRQSIEDPWVYAETNSIGCLNLL